MPLDVEALDFETTYLNTKAEVITEKMTKAGFPLSLVNEDYIPVIKRTFATEQEMIEYFKGAGIEQRIEFGTTAEQDAAILGKAEELGRGFSNYFIPGNHCGIFAEMSLYADGKGIKTLTNIRLPLEGLAFRYGGLLPFAAAALPLESPNVIGESLRILNNGILYDNY